MKKLIVINEIDLAVGAYLKEQGIKYLAKFQGTKTDDKREHDEFVISFTNGKNHESFHYSTGIDHRLSLIGENYKLSPKQIESVKALKDLIDTDRLDTTVIKVDFSAYVVRPTQASVLHCLFLDAQSGAESFDDFCDNFGYNNDSMQHFRIYQSCMETAKKIRNLFTSQQRQTLRDMLQDY
jgi:hypothetical protein